MPLGVPSEKDAECARCGQIVYLDDECVYCHNTACRVCMVRGNGGDCKKSITGQHEAFLLVPVFDDPGW